MKNVKKMIKMKKYRLDLDDLVSEYPYTKYDIGGMWHFIIVSENDLHDAINEMVRKYRKNLEESFVVMEDED